jgi:hypothetical protein
MNSDPILEEVWRIKDALAREAGYDVDRVFDELRLLTASEEKAGRQIIRSSEELRRYVAIEEARRQSEALVVRETPPPSKV